MEIGSYNTAASYIRELIGDIRINNQALNISNPILASMLFSKMETFKKKHVAFKINILTEDLGNILSSTDLIRLLSNLLDNAYDATDGIAKRTA